MQPRPGPALVSAAGQGPEFVDVVRRDPHLAAAGPHRGDIRHRTPTTPASIVEATSFVLGSIRETLPSVWLRPTRPPPQRRGSAAGCDGMVATTVFVSGRSARGVPCGRSGPDAVRAGREAALRVRDVIGTEAVTLCLRIDADDHLSPRLATQHERSRRWMAATGR